MGRTGRGGNGVALGPVLPHAPPSTSEVPVSKLLWPAALLLLALFALPAAAAEPGASLVGAGEAGPLSLLGVGLALAYARRRAILDLLHRVRLAGPLQGLHLGERLAFVHRRR